MKIEDEIKGRFRNDYHKAVINLIYTSNYINNLFVSFLKKHGLTSQQYNVLRILRGFGSEPQSIDFLKERMLDKSSDMSRIVERLFQKALVKREENLNDRRRKDIRITSEGLNLLGQLDECEKKVDNLLSNLSQEETIQFNKLLDKIRGQ
ncbi:MAG: MarR family transcriptional regulator [Calditrichaeota bacterium]|nr:MAG: MarR family transcriptional regulator [Calditrichota bacterium]MBL1208021.1 MarR family transcriptional regulator [Calditrichota bacterium]NOG47857.1 MarR family transcriptional regulator [Calditrichota bacterium]